jgi:two-component system response regulator NreC
LVRKIRVAILDDHESIIDGYRYRLINIPGVEVVATANYGEELEPMLTKFSVDVLLLDVQVPESKTNSNPFPILHKIPLILQQYPNLDILVISMHNQRTLIKAVIEAGASGYILKDDTQSIRELGYIISSVAKGGIYFSQEAYQQLRRRSTGELIMTPRQTEVLSLCAAFPDATTAEIADRLGVANSTIRNLLSGAYLNLEVRNRTAAIIKARQLGLITPLTMPRLIAERRGEFSKDGETSSGPKSQP